MKNKLVLSFISLYLNVFISFSQTQVVLSPGTNGGIEKFSNPERYSGGSGRVGNNYMNQEEYLTFQFFNLPTNIPQNTTITGAKITYSIGGTYNTYGSLVMTDLANTDIVDLQPGSTGWSKLKNAIAFGGPVSISQPGVINYTDADLGAKIKANIAAGKYYLRVGQRNGSGNSTFWFANNVTLTFYYTQAAPDQPKNFISLNTTSNSTDLWWSKPAGTISGYYIYKNGERIQTLNNQTYSTKITNLCPSTQYSFSVTAYNNIGESAPATTSVVTSILPSGSITGNTPLCIGENGTYTSQTAASLNPTTYIWSTSSNLTEVSGQGTNSYVAQNGMAQYQQGKVYLALGLPGCPSTYSYSSLDVWLGPPNIDYISGPTYTPNNQWSTYYAEPNNTQMGAIDYNWILNPLNGNSVYNYGWTSDIAFYNSGTYQLVVQASNVCGWSPYVVTALEVYDAYGLSFSPNPTNGETTLTIESAKEMKSSNLEWELEIYTQTQLLKEKMSKLKGCSTVINTSGWQDGIYIVRVKYNGKVYTSKLVVKK